MPPRTASSRQDPPLDRGCARGFLLARRCGALAEPSLSFSAAFIFGGPQCGREEDRSVLQCTQATEASANSKTAPAPYGTACERVGWNGPPL